ncbi:hypothetical protein MASR1M8_15940 [Thermomonas brevis]
MNLLTLSDTATKLTKTPFAPGFNAVFFNNSGAAATLQGSQDGTTYTTLVNAAANGTMTAVASLPPYVKLAAAGNNVYLLQGGN